LPVNPIGTGAIFLLFPLACLPALSPDLVWVAFLPETQFHLFEKIFVAQRRSFSQDGI